MDETAPLPSNAQIRITESTTAGAPLHNVAPSPAVPDHELFVVDCRVNPSAQSGHNNETLPPLVWTIKVGESATRARLEFGPAAMAITPFNPLGTVLSPFQSAPQAATVPSDLSARL